MANATAQVEDHLTTKTHMLFRRSIPYQAIRWMYRSLFPWARNSLNLALLLTVHDRAVRRVEFNGINRVLVLAPHPDDEAIGPGGALLLHKQEGARVTVVYMTDGRWGDPEGKAGILPEEERLRRQLQFVARRKLESRRCGEVLNLDRQMFLDIEDGRLMPTNEVVKSLHEILEKERPQVLYVPFFMEGHEDHWQTARVLERCLTDGGPNSGVIIRCYEVWMPLVANRLADIGPVADLKWQAIAAYQSQLQDRDYVRYVKGLNQYRAMTHRADYAEAFFEATPEEFCFLVRKASRS